MSPPKRKNNDNLKYAIADIGGSGSSTNRFGVLSSFGIYPHGHKDQEEYQKRISAEEDRAYRKGIELEMGEFQVDELPPTSAERIKLLKLFVDKYLHMNECPVVQRYFGKDDERVWISENEIMTLKVKQRKADFKSLIRDWKVSILNNKSNKPKVFS